MKIPGVRGEQKFVDVAGRHTTEEDLRRAVEGAGLVVLILQHAAFRGVFWLVAERPDPREEIDWGWVADVLTASLSGEYFDPSLGPVEVREEV